MFCLRAQNIYIVTFLFRNRAPITLDKTSLHSCITSFSLKGNTAAKSCQCYASLNKFENLFSKFQPRLIRHQYSVFPLLLFSLCKTKLNASWAIFVSSLGHEQEKDAYRSTYLGHKGTAGPTVGYAVCVPEFY